MYSITYKCDLEEKSYPSSVKILTEFLKPAVASTFVYLLADSRILVSSNFLIITSHHRPLRVLHMRLNEKR